VFLPEIFSVILLQLLINNDITDIHRV